MSSESLWYAGRLARRRGAHGDVDVLASATVEGWEPIKNARKLFPKSGQVEILGSAVSALGPGDWLVFQVVPKRRLGTASFKISANRPIPRYLDMARLGSIEAARSLFCNTGWLDGRQPGRWAIRFTSDHLLILDLVREQGGTLRAAHSGLQRIRSYSFDAAHIMPEPGIAEPVDLYDLGEAAPVAEYDWSADADYIAHVVRSLAGASDPRLEELIAWLELHRDESTGRVSAAGANPEKAFDAIRSGELAMRLSTDKALMAAYLSAVRDDPAIARAVAEAAAQAAITDRESVLTALRSELLAAVRSELDADHGRERTRQDKELRERERTLLDALEQRVKERGVSLERELENRVAAMRREAEEQAAAEYEVLAGKMAELTTDRGSILAERDRLQTEAVGLADDIAALVDKRRIAEEEISRLSLAISALAPRADVSARTFVRLSEVDDARIVPLTIEGLAAEISRAALLTRQGKALMEHFATLMLAGELPILEGEQTDDFALVAEALIAAGRLVPFDLDATILTPEDIWSRPGSGIASQVAQASDRAQEGDGTFLVQLRGIERSAARAWYPALAAVARRGLLARRLLLFATVIDPESEEAQALPNDACRMRIREAIVPGAWLVAPNLLGSGPGSVAFQLNPGNRVDDLSPALTVFPELGAEVNLAMSLRVARVVVETLRMRPGDHAAALMAAREFCSSAGRGPLAERRVKGEQKNA